MFKWLQNKFSETQRREAEQFLVSMQGADDDVIDMISASAMYWAAFYAARGPDLYSMAQWMQKEQMFPAQIVSTIKGLQKQGSTASATGLMVWLHSARALLWPELRLLGRQIWQELNKATESAEFDASEMCSATGTPEIPFDRKRAPFGLEALTR